MELWSLPKARPISCSVCPAFQRRHTSHFCSAESPNRLPGLINTTFESSYIQMVLRRPSEPARKIGKDRPGTNVGLSPSAGPWRFMLVCRRPGSYLVGWLESGSKRKGYFRRTPFFASRTVSQIDDDIASRL